MPKVLNITEILNPKHATSPADQILRKLILVDLLILKYQNRSMVLKQVNDLTNYCQFTSKLCHKRQ